MIVILVHLLLSFFNGAVAPILVSRIIIVNNPKTNFIVPVVTETAGTKFY